MKPFSQFQKSIPTKSRVSWIILFKCVRYIDLFNTPSLNEDHWIVEYKASLNIGTKWNEFFSRLNFKFLKFGEKSF